jgi:hypothetical protein
MVNIPTIAMLIGASAFLGVVFFSVMSMVLNWIDPPNK